MDGRSSGAAAAAADPRFGADGPQGGLREGAIAERAGDPQGEVPGSPGAWLIKDGDND